MVLKLLLMLKTALSTNPQLTLNSIFYIEKFKS